MKQDVTLGKMLPVRPLRVNDFYRSFKNICGTKITSNWQSIGCSVNSNLGQREERN